MSRRTRPEIVADAIATLTRQNKDLTDLAIAEQSKLSVGIVAEILDTQLGQVWSKLPLGWRIGRVENAVSVSRPSKQS